MKVYHIYMAHVEKDSTVVMVDSIGDNEDKVDNDDDGGVGMEKTKKLNSFG